MAYFELVWNGEDNLYEEIQNFNSFSDLLESKGGVPTDQHLSFFLLVVPDYVVPQIYYEATRSLKDWAEKHDLSCLDPVDCTNEILCNNLAGLIGQILFSCRDCYRSNPPLNERREELHHDVMQRQAMLIDSTLLKVFFSRVDELTADEKNANIGYFARIFNISQRLYNQIKETKLPNMIVGAARFDYSERDFLNYLWHIKQPEMNLTDFIEMVRKENLFNLSTPEDFEKIYHLTKSEENGGLTHGK